MSAERHRLACTRNCTAINKRLSWEGWGLSRENMPLSRREVLRRCLLTMTDQRLSAMSFRLVSTGGTRELFGRDRTV